MFFKNKPADKKRVLALSDIRSDGIRLALVLSKRNDPFPEIIWSHFDALPASYFSKGNEKRLQAAIKSSLARLEMDGLRFLLQHFPELKPETLKVTVSAPLSETVARGVKLSGNIPTEVTTDQIDLIRRGIDKRQTVPAEQILKNRLGVSFVTGPLLPYGQNLYELVTILPTPIYQELVSARERMLPKANLQVEPRLGNYLYALDKIPHKTDSICLIDVTPSATEVCLINDNSIEATGQMSYGMSELEAALSGKTGLPQNQIAHLFKDNDVDAESSLRDSDRLAKNEVYEDFERRLAGLLQKTAGNGLPNTIFLSADPDKQRFLLERIKNLSLFRDRPSLHAITPKLLRLDDADDLILALNAYIFHKRDARR